MTVDLSLYVVVDPQFTGGRDPIAVARSALLGGATMLQLRDKFASTRVLLATAQELVALAHGRGARLIVNDRADVALAAGADGVHLGPDDLPVTAARTIMGPRALIGFSAGTPEEAHDAEKSGANYLGTGAIYATSSKPDAGAAIGVAGLVATCRATRLPVVAIGGIGQGRAAPCIAAGAAGVATMTAVTQAADVERAARALRDEVDAARRAERA